MKAKLITYWIATVLIAFMLASGGVMYFMCPPEVLEGITKLGYPAYLLYILGAWKILGAAAICAPGFPRLKEWAYAGIFFDLTGASASHFFAHDYGPGAFHLLVPLALIAVMFVSWCLRPASRRI